MLRRLIVAGMAAALALPIFATPPASAAILFSCSFASIDALLTPGLSHNPAAQTVSVGNISAGSYLSGCGGGGGSASIVASPLNSYPPRPLGCPESFGGAAGNNYPDQTPLLIGADGTFTLTWATGPASTGIPKVKSSDLSGQLKIVFVITSGQFSPPAGQKTKLKGSVQFNTIYDSANCFNDSDPAQLVNFVNAGSVFVNQQ